MTTEFTTESPLTATESISTERDSSREEYRKVIIVGGGVAGLAAGCALADAGFRVQLMERRGYLGGRASSYVHPGTGEIIDNCQHILLGCCTNLIDLYHRLGVEKEIRWFNRITFVEPGGRRSLLRHSGLPAPLHSALSFLTARAFSWWDKISIARGVLAFLGELPPDSRHSFGDWLEQQGQSPGAIERFWKPVMVSALNEELNRISIRYAGQVIRELFLKSPEAGMIGVPMVPLSQLYGRAIDYIKQRNGEVKLYSSVGKATWNRETEKWMVGSGNEEWDCDALLLAMSFESTAKFLSNIDPPEPGMQLLTQLHAFEHSPITGVHLWFDREITDLEYAALLDSPLHWMFHKSRLQPQREAKGSYVELIITASKSLVNMARQEVVAMAVTELGRFFPIVKEAKLVKSALIKEVRATYSIRPLLDRLRYGARSPWPRAYLAGDWTDTGWPATMEGAVRSGYLAAEAICRSTGEMRNILKPDLPATGLMQLLG
jgi:squalene-associated FAD-dependent desaturase